ncbi:DUF6603 domain-containing protein [Actinoplanes sp. NPDC051346]|uniref:DUF6603 domain-containing protein n=1 Tax=Actinoplanes sp. NPDC051346 TaxID=3155048 RepID=UPI003442B81D
MTSDIGGAVVRVADAMAAPLLAATTPEGLRRVLFAAGWEEFGDLDVAATVSALSGLKDAIGDAVEDPPEDLLMLGLLIARLAEPAATVAQAVAAAPDAPAEIITDVAEVLLTAVLARIRPALPILELLGVAEPADVPAYDAGGWRRRPMRRTRVSVEGLTALLRDPIARLRDLAAEPGALVAVAWPLVIDALEDLGVGATTADTDPAAPDAAELSRILVVDVLTRRPVPDYTRIAVAVTDEPGTGLTVTVALSPGLDLTWTRGGWRATVAIPGPQVVRFDKTGIAAEADMTRFTVGAGYASTSTPALRFGAEGGMNLTVNSASLDVRVMAGAAGADFAGSLALDGLALSVAATDGLLSTLLGGAAQVNGDLRVQVSARDGVTFVGSRAPRLVLSGKRSIGPVDLLDVAVELLLDGGPGVELTAGIAAKLGPLALRVDRMGVQLRVRAAGDPAVSLPITAGLRPPAGIGALISAGPVTGGGYLFLDFDAGQYAGVLQLQFKAIAITAIGLINTKLPGGRPGWSFLILVAVEFPGLPLGFGISLYGLGGIVGVNRSINTGEMRDAVRAGRLDSVLFPRDPVTNAAQVLGDLQRMFPTEVDRFTIGVMAKLGWGPGPLITVEAGVIVELPSPVKLVVLAKLRAVLPTADAALVQLRLDVAGIVDFGRGDISIDGALTGSRIGPFAIAGEMALRASWGATKHFTMAAGGFHPRFLVPEGFPVLRRISISLADAENPRLRLETYLALTAATVQLGAKLEVYAETEVLGQTISGSAMIGFDALVRFLPRFGFEVDLFGAITISLNAVPLLTAALELRLTGTAPWTATGVARVRIAFLPEVSVRVEATVGQPDSSVGLTVSIAERIIAELGRPAAIEALPVAGGSGAVVLSQPPEAARAAHPGARVVVRQRTAPFGAALSRLGGATPSDPGTYSLSVALSGTAASTTMVTDLFSPSQFGPENPESALGRPEFEAMTAGVALSDDRMAVAAAPVRMIDTTDDRVIGPAEDRVIGSTEDAPGPGLPAAVVVAWAQAEADRCAARPGAAERFCPAVRPQRLSVKPERWVVADPGSLVATGAAVPAMVADQAVARRGAAGPAVLAMPEHEAAIP